MPNRLHQRTLLLPGLILAALPILGQDVPIVTTPTVQATTPQSAPSPTPPSTANSPTQTWQEHWVEYAGKSYRDELKQQPVIDYSKDHFFLKGIETIPEAKTIFVNALTKSMMDMGFFPVTKQFTNFLKTRYCNLQPKVSGSMWTSAWASHLDYMATNNVDFQGAVKYVFVTKDKKSLTQWADDFTFLNSRNIASKATGKICDISVAIGSEYLYNPAKKGVDVSFTETHSVYGLPSGVELREGDTDTLINSNAFDDSEFSRTFQSLFLKNIKPEIHLKLPNYKPLAERVSEAVEINRQMNADLLTAQKKVLSEFNALKDKAAIKKIIGAEWDTKDYSEFMGKKLAASLAEVLSTDQTSYKDDELIDEIHSNVSGMYETIKNKKHYADWGFSQFKTWASEGKLVQANSTTMIRTEHDKAVARVLIIKSAGDVELYQAWENILQVSLGKLDELAD